MQLAYKRDLELLNSKLEYPLVFFVDGVAVDSFIWWFRWSSVCIGTGSICFFDEDKESLRISHTLIKPSVAPADDSKCSFWNRTHETGIDFLGAELGIWWWWWVDGDDGGFRVELFDLSTLDAPLPVCLGFDGFSTKWAVFKVFIGRIWTVCSVLFGKLSIDSISCLLHLKSNMSMEPSRDPLDITNGLLGICVIDLTLSVWPFSRAVRSQVLTS